ncbi:hypothetical protein HID58_013070 [Brassica napus]|uniref:BnaA03g50420D protein n=3 Tax=Brassica TaxID=3705 RepID=A0A078HL86_BRANA|nr:hypothetical protein HID58_012997 [Brassica napus]CAG7884881.1 unnamed protein product [Brassica rapa]KAH0935953.1 hypothetical protein HID58_013070 [Brassica napus]CAF2132355.1 unnamed protein product [Brassica napus]CAF2132584.1 unnamed protein product [Brassica napus]
MESSERLVRLGQDPTSEIPFTGNREITKIDDVAIHSTPQDLPLAAAEHLTKPSRARRRPNKISSPVLPHKDAHHTSSSFLVKKKNSKKKVNGHGQLSLRLDRDEILLLEYLDDPHRSHHRFISATGFSHGHVTTLLHDANVDLLILYKLAL